MKLFQTEEEILAMREEPPMPQFKTTFGDFLKKNEGLYVLFGMETFICFVICLNSVSVMLCSISEEGLIPNI